jgi:hypothetical protein
MIPPDFVGKASGKRQRRGMYIVTARKSWQAPSGATSERGYAAPLGLRQLSVSEHLYTSSPSGFDPQNPAGSGDLRFEIDKNQGLVI